jgi:hypothetical protein
MRGCTYVWDNTERTGNCRSALISHMTERVTRRVASDAASCSDRVQFFITAISDFRATTLSLIVPGIHSPRAYQAPGHYLVAWSDFGARKRLNQKFPLDPFKFLNRLQHLPTTLESCSSVLGVQNQSHLSLMRMLCKKRSAVYSQVPVELCSFPLYKMAGGRSILERSFTLSQAIL